MSNSNNDQDQPSSEQPNNTKPKIISYRDTGEVDVQKTKENDLNDGGYTNYAFHATNSSMYPELDSNTESGNTNVTNRKVSSIALEMSDCASGKRQKEANGDVGEEPKDIEMRNKLKEHEISDSEKLLYSVEDNPPWYTCILLGLQHYLMMVESTVSIPYLLTPLLCLPDHHPARALIASTIIFVSGLVTILQTTFGVRLPIVQGGTHGFLGPILSILALLPCPENQDDYDLEELWTVRMRSIQGAICIASIFQIVVGATGAIGVLLRWITPLVIVPTISLIGFSLYPVATEKCASNWGIAVLTIVLLIIFSQYLGDVPVPVPSMKNGKVIMERAYIFKLIPVVLAIGIAWFVCYILTVTDAIDVLDAARTDRRLAVVTDAPWFRIPYPCQWGLPKVTVAGVVGVLAGVLATIVESIGDYYACARIAGAPTPPPHAINRGIFIEGVGTMLAGLFGTGSGTTSYSQNIGAIAVTKVGSRRVIQWAGLIMLLCGVVGKVGAVFIIIPEPIIGGIFVVVFSMITSVGLSALQHVNLSAPRNLFVIGFSIFTGLAIPMWVRADNHKELINTGLPELDQVLIVLLTTSMFVGGLLGFVLDNTIPGTDADRGVLLWRKQLENVSSQDRHSSNTPSSYDLPIGMNYLRRWSWTKYIPILPTFEGFASFKKNSNASK